MHPDLSHPFAADRQRDLLRQAETWRVLRRSRVRPTAAQRWHLQSPIVRRPAPNAVVTPCP